MAHTILRVPATLPALQLRRVALFDAHLANSPSRLTSLRCSIARWILLFLLPQICE
jgi:hypothetical protein